MVISSVDVHGRVNYFTKLTTSRGDSSVLQAYWSFAPNLRATLFTVYIHPQFQRLLISGRWFIDIDQVVSDIKYTFFHLCSTVDAQSSTLL